MRFRGKTALISGAGRNIGRAIALAFAGEGADVVLVARTGPDVEQVAAECETSGVKALPLAADVSRHEQVNQVVQQGLGRFGKIDVLVSVVGLRPHRPFWDFGYDEWQQAFNVNVHSTFFFAKALAPSMIERRSGSIVALGGMSSLTAMRPGISLVAASKHGLYGLIKAMAIDLGEYGIRANLIAVGNIDTERRNPEWYLQGHELRPEHQHLALRRNGRPEEVASAALFLGSEEASYITGDCITCSGGRFPGM
jgi:3-oxoacyl-[acyl-carrier protein] reductase